MPDRCASTAEDERDNVGQSWWTRPWILCGHRSTAPGRSADPRRGSGHVSCVFLPLRAPFLCERCIAPLDGRGPSVLRSTSSFHYATRPPHVRAKSKSVQEAGEERERNEARGRMERTCTCACRSTDGIVRGGRRRDGSTRPKRMVSVRRARLDERDVTAHSALGFAMGGYAMGAYGGGALSKMASTVGMLIGAAWFWSKMSEAAVDHEEGPNPECATCEGTGKVPCMCTRWSDGDVGCSTCRGTGRMACPACRGSGTGVPIPLAIKIEPGEGRR